MKPLSRVLAVSTSLVALGVAAFAATAHAGANADAAKPQPAATQSADTSDQGGLTTVVVTASKGNKTQLKSSVAVTNISKQEIENYAPRGEASLYRLIPGVLVQGVTDSPGGNLNISARGIPSYVGGAEYVQLQENGLPIMLFGDIQFGNADYWVRYDDVVDRVESQVGGRDSTFASQGPSAIINYIDKTGQKDGGDVGIEKALNYDQTRVNFNVGEHITDTLHFDVGGFVKEGHDARHFGYLASKGYQIKGNITQDFPDGRGFFRLNFKRLDDQEPVYTENPVIADVTSTGSPSAGLVTTVLHGFSKFPGFDARDQTNQSIYAQQWQVLNLQNEVTTATAQGIHPKITSFGGQLHYNFETHVTIDDNFRYSEGSGVFNTQFYNAVPTSSVIGSTVNGQTVASIKYAAGPNAGNNFAGGYINNNPNINTNMTDVGNFANDLKVSGDFETNGLKINAFAGWFHMRQTIAMNWHINPTYSDSVAGGAPLDLFAANGAQLTASGQAGFNNNWGYCCATHYAFNFTDDAPYIDGEVTWGKLDLDASMRFDSVRAEGFNDGEIKGPTYTIQDGLGQAQVGSIISSGMPGPSKYYYLDGQVPGSTPMGLCSDGTGNCAAGNIVNYTKTYTSWSFGALYSLSSNTSIYARISKGGRFNADRQTVNANRFNADGSLNAIGKGDAVNFVTQQELGVKSRGPLLGGHYDVSTTLFQADLDEHNYNLTTAAGQNPFTDAKFHSYGVEFNGGYHIDHFTIEGLITYTHANYAADSGDTPVNLTGFQAPRSPKWQYVITPSYEANWGHVGFSIDGQDGTWNYNVYEPTKTTPGYVQAIKLTATTFVNAFAAVHLSKSIDLMVNVDNVFNTLGFRSADNGFNGGNVLSTAVGLGTTATASLRYKF